MDEIWERAVETALDGENDVASVRTLTLDGAAKCVHGRLPPPSIFEKFSNLQHLSIANIGLSSLEQFPRLRNLQKLVLSDNRISGGLEFLVEAGLEFLIDLDLSNNRISDVNDLRPLAKLRLVSLDLYECPVTRVKDYRSRAFELIGSLKYLDKMDAEGNERPESDDEDEDSDDDDDAGSGEIEGENRPFSLSNEYLTRNDGVIDVDEDEESDADEEVTETSRGVNGLSGASNSHHLSNGLRVEDEGDESEEDDDSVEEIYEEDEGEEDDVVEVHELDDSSDKEDGVEDDEDDEEDDEELDNDEGDFEEPDSNGRLIGVEGEIDGHEQGEEDDNGETGEEDLDDEEDGDFEDEDEEEDYGTGYLIQPVGQIQVDADGSHLDQGNEGEDTEKEEDISDEDDQDGSLQEIPTSSRKRKRDKDNDNEEDDDEEEEKKHK